METAMVAALQHVREVRSSTRRWRGLWRSSEAGRGGEGRPVAMATASDGESCAPVRTGKREPAEGEVPWKREGVVRKMRGGEVAAEGRRRRPPR